MKGTDWYRKSGGVHWQDVWRWTDKIRDEFGYWTKVTIHPPLPSTKEVDFNLVVECTLANGQVAQGRHLLKSLAVHRSANVTPEGVALQMVSAVYMDLDRQKYEAERAAGQGEMLL